MRYLVAAALSGAMYVSAALAYQPSPNMRVIVGKLIEQDLQTGLSGGKALLSATASLTVVDPRAVAIAYMQNEVAANQLYEGRVTLLRGRAMSIQDGMGKPFVEFAYSGEWGVRAYFIPSEQRELAKIHRLDPVEAVCKGAGVVMGVPMFKGCVMASTWESIVTSEVNRGVSDFYAGRSVTREAKMIGVLAVAIAGIVPKGGDCSNDEDVCLSAMQRFQNLTMQEQTDLVARAANELKKSGLPIGSSEH
ncbi:OB-fold putative lipoprotein [Achromobacter insuavis]|uniref:OB-fold putative lipoprotein n=1 Tax=Achromobacter insuavis TaxID=1287735 RepID=UPI001EEF202F|nr:OB-fold putative lipoprotein [Achromobacter insuavis]